MGSFYDLTAHRSTERPTVLVHWPSLKSLLTLYCSLWQSVCSSKKRLFHKSQKTAGNRKHEVPYASRKLCGWGCATKKLLLGTKTTRKELQGDEFFVSELGPWEPLRIAKKKEVGSEVKVGEGMKKEGGEQRSGKGREMVS